MTRDEAEAEAARLSKEHPQRAIYRWLARVRWDDQWEVVRMRMPIGTRIDPLTATIEAKPFRDRMNADASSDVAGRWELTAPESHVLRYRGNYRSGEGFKLAVKELVARRVLRVERVQGRRWLAGGPRHVLIDGASIGSEVAAPLAPVLEMYRRARRRSVPVLRAGSTVAVTVAGCWSATW